MKRSAGIVMTLVVLSAATAIVSQQIPSGDAALGTLTYDDFEKPTTCGICHTDIYQQWTQTMMSQAYTHHWDEIEYFDLAVPHADMDEMVAGVKAGCNGCHAPLAFLAGDIPPPRPSENSRANESVSCDICHTIVGFEGDTPYNFNFLSSPGRNKQGPKPNRVSPHHEAHHSDFIRSADLCGTCHNEMSPYGVWVKATHLEWRDGPYSQEGVTCQKCHAPRAWHRATSTAKEDSIAQHLFHGAHDRGKLAGSVELRMHPREREVEVGSPVVIEVQLYNAKAGHMIPTGSVEDRIMWLHVTAVDGKGGEFHLAVDPKGFEGEEYTIAADVLAYQDMGIPLRLTDFEGVQRDGVPVGDRIYRMPYFDPQGRMTIMQWNTKSLGVDYRIGPRETKIETFTWDPPAGVAPGRVTFRAELNFCKLVKPVADFLKVPEDETEAVLINDAATWVEIYD